MPLTLSTLLLQKLSGACRLLAAPVLGCAPEQVGKDAVLYADIPLWNTLEWTLPEHRHRLLALDGPLGGNTMAA